MGSVCILSMTPLAPVRLRGWKPNLQKPNPQNLQKLEYYQQLAQCLIIICINGEKSKTLGVKLIFRVNWCPCGNKLQLNGLKFRQALKLLTRQGILIHTHQNIFNKYLRNSIPLIEIRGVWTTVTPTQKMPTLTLICFLFTTAAPEIKYAKNR